MSYPSIPLKTIRRAIDLAGSPGHCPYTALSQAERDTTHPTTGAITALREQLGTSTVSGIFDWFDRISDEAGRPAAREAARDQLRALHFPTHLLVERHAIFEARDVILKDNGTWRAQKYRLVYLRGERLAQRGVLGPGSWPEASIEFVVEVGLHV